ncbi:MAG: class I SAM-dependent methyltransferase [Phycisphaeraceae bacterium]|nr:class I SAM-dependent methyltransferase [Phycisphaeraceae bacterium]
MTDIAEYYDKSWSRPELYNDRTTPLRMALLRKHLPAAGIAPGARVLDLGCGCGEFSGFFKELGYEAEGIDISANAVEYARRNHPGPAYHVGEVQTLLPARAGAFDAVFSSEVIEHLFDVEGYLRSINRLLKPRGVLVLTTPYHGVAKNIVIAMSKFSRHFDPLGQHIRFFDKPGLEMCLRKFGFAPEVWTGFGRFWPLWMSHFVVSRKAHDV